MKDAIALNLNGIEKGFCGVQVLHGINLVLRQGEVLGLVGENGAGKSTIMNIIGGVHFKDSGTMEVFGKVYNPVSPKNAMNEGISFIHQELNLFSNLTVAENMFIEDFPTNKAKAIDYKKINEKTQEIIMHYSLPVKPNTIVGSLSTGVCQMIEIAKGLMRNARIMIFDEPTTSLSHSEKEKLFHTIRELKSKNISIIYISHILEDVFELSDSIAVLRDGCIVYDDKAENITQEKLIAQMVGREIDQLYPQCEKETEEEITLSAQNIISSDGKVKDMSLDLHKSEILGMYGLVGSGRTEFVRAIYGLSGMVSGEIKVKGVKVSNPTPQKSIKNGIALVSEDRHLEGLLLAKPVSENLTLVKIKDILKRFSVVDQKEEEKIITESIRKLNIKVTDAQKQTADSLSGGNQQKIVFGKWIAIDPDIFILDEPTRGVDVGAKFEIYSIIMEMAKKGASVLVISSEMEELMGICDRIIVVKDGAISGELSKEEFSQEAIIKLAL